MSMLDALPTDVYHDEELISQPGHVISSGIMEHHGTYELVVLVHPPHAGECSGMAGLPVSIDAQAYQEIVDLTAEIKGMLS